LVIPAFAAGLFAPSFGVWLGWVGVIALVVLVPAVVMRRARPWLVYLGGGLALGMGVWYCLALWNVLHGV